MMLMQTEAGEGVILDRPGASEVFGRLYQGSDEEILGVFAKILREGGIPLERSAKILRVNPSSVARYLKKPLPGIGEDRADP